MGKKVTAAMLDEFVAFMGAFDNEDMPDGAWWQMLEDGAEAFFKRHGIKGDPNSAVHQYLEHR